MQSKRALVIYAAANLLGLLIFVSSVLIIDRMAKMEQRDYDFGDSLNFILTGVPAFLVCLVLNIVWGLLAVINSFRRRGNRALWATVGAVTAWTASVLILRAIP